MASCSAFSDHYSSLRASCAVIFLQRPNGKLFLEDRFNAHDRRSCPPDGRIVGQPFVQGLPADRQ